MLTLLALEVLGSNLLAYESLSDDNALGIDSPLQIIIIRTIICICPELPASFFFFVV